MLYIYVTLFAGREVRIGKSIPEVLSTAWSRGPRVDLKTEGTILPNTNRPRLVNNIFIIFLKLNEILSKRTRMI